MCVWGVAVSFRQIASVGRGEGRPSTSGKLPHAVYVAGGCQWLMLPSPCAARRKDLMPGNLSVKNDAYVCVIMELIAFIDLTGFHA